MTIPLDSANEQRAVIDACDVISARRDEFDPNAVVEINGLDGRPVGMATGTRAIVAELIEKR